MIPIIPVLDVMNGGVVHAVGGRRSEYKPIVSELTKSTEPADVLRALVDVTGSHIAYVADLDAIQHGGQPSSAILNLIDAASCRLWIDFGISTVNNLSEIPSHVVPVIGTETIESFEVARAARQRFAHVVGSIDCSSGVAIGTNRHLTPIQLAKEFLNCGIDQMIALDLAAVGTAHSDSLNLVERVMSVEEIVGAVEPTGKVFVGGGIHNRDDLRLYQNAGAAGVLVASALHDGTLP